MEAVSPKDEENNVSAFGHGGRQPAQLPHPGDPKVGDPEEAQAGVYCLPEEEAISVPGSAEEDEDKEAVQALTLGQELQCKLQLHLDQLEAKAKAKAKAKAAATAAAQGSSESALGAPDGPQPFAFQSSQGEPHIRAQQMETILGQVPEVVMPGGEGSSSSFGGPLWGTGWCLREKGEIAAEAWRAPNMELKGQASEGADTLGLTHEHQSIQKPGEVLTPFGEQLVSLCDPETFASGEEESLA